jgi:hypothetical protein
MQFPNLILGPHAAQGSAPKKERLRPCKNARSQGKQRIQIERLKNTA